MAVDAPQIGRHQHVRRDTGVLLRDVHLLEHLDAKVLQGLCLNSRYRFPCHDSLHLIVGCYKANVTQTIYRGK